jgi:hypothetical protein
LKALSGTAWAEVVPAELLQQFLLPMHQAESPLDMGLRGVSPSSAYLTFRKEGRLSSSPWRRMTGLLFLVPDYRSRGRVVSQVKTRPSSMRKSTTLPNKEMKLTSVERIGRSQLISGVRRTVEMARGWAS